MSVGGVSVWFRFLVSMFVSLLFVFVLFWIVVCVCSFSLRVGRVVCIAVCWFASGVCFIFCFVPSSFVCVRFGLLCLRVFGRCLCVCVLIVCFGALFVRVLVCCCCARWFIVFICFVCPLCVCWFCLCMYFVLLVL